MLLAWENKADNALVSADSEITSLPASNVQQVHLSRKWYTGVGVKTARILFDMGASVSCSALAVLGTNLTPNATLRLRASDADPSALGTLLLDTGVVAAGVKAGYGAAYKIFADAPARYWGLDLSDPSVADDNLRIGRIFLGPSWQNSQSLLYGWSITPLDPSILEESRGGQAYADELPQRRLLEMTLDFLTEALVFANPFAMARANGIVRDVLAIPMETSLYISEQAVWGKVEAAEPAVHRNTRIFRYRLRIKETL